MRYPKDPITIICNEKSYPNQRRDLKLFNEEYVGEHLFSLIITNEKMETYYPIEIIDLRCQVDYVTTKKIGVFEEHVENPHTTNL